MATKQGEVELVIRAKNDASKSLNDITKSLKDLQDQQTIIGDSAEKADRGLSQLGKELAALRANAQNLKAVSDIARVLDTATAAIERQRSAVTAAASTQKQLTSQQEQLTTQQTELAASLKQAQTALAGQQTALTSAKANYADLGKEASTLNLTQDRLNKSLESTTARFLQQDAALREAQDKYQKLAAAVNSSEAPTKRMVASMEAAERAMQRRQTALDATVAKEAELREKLEQGRQALAANTAAREQANASIQQQNAVITQSKQSITDLNTQSRALGQSQRTVASEIGKSASALEQLESGLNQAETEYEQVTATANAARQAIGAQAASATEAGRAAAQASVELATFAARMKTLQAAGNSRTTSGAIGFSAEDVSAAIRALTNAQTVIRATSDSASRAAVSMDQLETAVKSAGDAGNTLTGLSTALTRQEAAIAGAQGSWKAAEAEVRRLAQALRAADEPSEALAAAFGQAQAKAKLAKTEFQQQQQTANQMAQALQQAGIGVGTLASAQATLRLAISGTNSAISQGNQAIQQFGAASGNAAGGGNRFASVFRSISGSAAAVGSGVLAAGRAVGQFRQNVQSATTATSSFGGELRGMVTNLAGVYAIKTALEGVITTANQMDGAAARFAVGFGGNMEKANAEMQFGVDVAKNLKLPIVDLVSSYSQLSIAAQGTALEGKGVRDVFTAFAQAARVNRQSTDELKGSFLALTQIISKGKVSAEELRGQLGDRMPGAMNIMASAIGVPVEKLSDMMEKGQLTTEALVHMAAEVSRRVGPQLAAALDSPQAKMQAFKNSWMELQLALARSGFLDAIATALENIGNALSRPEVIQGVKDLGQGIADLINYIGSLNISLEDVKLVAEGFLGVFALNTIAGIVGSIVTMTTAFYGLATAITVASAATAPFVIAAGVLAAVFATAWLADWAYENFGAFREAVWTVGTVTQQVGSTIQMAFDVAFAYIKGQFASVVAEVQSQFASFVANITAAFSGVLNTVGVTAMDGLAQKAKQQQEDAAEGAKNAWIKTEQDIAAARERAHQRNLAREREIAAERAKYAKQEEANKPKPVVTPTIPGMTGPGLGVVTGPGTPFTPNNSKAEQTAANAAARKRASLEQQVANQMYQIRSQLEKKSAQSLDEALAAVPAKYAKLYDQLRAIGKDQGSEEWKTVDALVAQEQQIVRNTYAKKEQQAETARQREGEQAINTLLATRRDLLEQIKYAEKKGDTETADRLKERYNEINGQIEKAIDNQLAFWATSNDPNADLMIQKLKAMKDGLNDLGDKDILSVANVAKQLGSSLKGFGDDFIDKIAETGNIFQSLKDSFQSFVSSFLIGIAKMIMQQAIFNALKAAGNATGLSGFFGTAASAVASAHTGGIAGSPGLNRRTVNMGMFANATKYHTGGVVGLQPWEVPIIAKKNEEVLTESDPRHINNLSKGSSQPTSDAGGSGTTIINAIDSDSVVQAGLSSPAGQRVLINFIKANKSTVKSILG